MQIYRCLAACKFGSAEVCRSGVFLTVFVAPFEVLLSAESQTFSLEMSVLFMEHAQPFHSLHSRSKVNTKKSLKNICYIFCYLYSPGPMHSISFLDVNIDLTIKHSSLSLDGFWIPSTMVSYWIVNGLGINCPILYPTLHCLSRLLVS